MEEKPTVSAYINRIAAILAVLIAVGGFFFLIFISAKNQQDMNKKIIVTRGTTVVEEVLTCISNKEINRAIEIIDNKVITDVNLQQDIRHYLTNFWVFYRYIQNPKKNQTEVYTEFFILNSYAVKEYLQNQCGYTKNQAHMLAEVIPYYLIEINDQKNKKNSKLYKEYLNAFTTESGISQKTADILCLYIQNNFLESKLSETSLKQQINKIKQFQTMYERELGPNGIYTDQKNYLETFSQYLSSKINSNFTILIFENYPKYNL